MGEIDGAFRSWGFSRGGTGAISMAIAGAAQEAGVEIRTQAPVERIKVEAAGPRASCWPAETSSTRTVVVSSVRSPPDLPQARRARRPGRPGSWTRCGDSSCAAPRARSTWRWTACLTSRACRVRERTCAGPSRSPPASSTWSGPTTTRSTATSRASPTSTWSFPPSPTRRWPRLASTCSRASSSTRPTSCARAPGTRSARRSATPSSTRSAEYAPNIKQLILHRQVLTPLDLEREWGLTEGNIFQGELSLEQLFFLRPVPGWARYRTPVREPLPVRLVHASRAAASWARTAAWRPWRS